jgi:hypothetical protein
MPTGHKNKVPEPWAELSELVAGMVHDLPGVR